MAKINLKDKIIQLVVFQDNLLGLTQSGKIIKQETYSEVDGEEAIATSTDSIKKRIKIKSRWIEY